METILEEQKKTQFNPQSLDNGKDVACFVLLENNNLNLQTKVYNLEICGKSLLSWVTRACPTRPIVLEKLNGDSVIETIRPYLTSSEYTLVLFADTPLMTRSNINGIMDFVVTRGLNVCKLTRGYVFRTEYIKRVGEIYTPQTYYFEEEDFMMVSSLSQLSIIADIMKNRILSYHMNNGVVFKDAATTFISGDACIGKGTVIEGCTCLYGKIIIGENCKIGAGSKLENTRIYDNTKIGSAIIKNSVVKENCEIGENVVIEKSCMIKENCTLLNNIVLSGVVIEENSKIENGKIIVK